ncbi:MAG: exodeoxyribonuclease VII small subunit [Phycisphaerales bacterium]|nr:MAG: exodeoxyribonuclease VII small subunit [Phycisphaerales bacterium]
MGKKKLTFEESLSQLETIAERIEKGEIGLEESITEYEKGMGLVKQCREILANAEQRIQRLQERSDGTLETAEFTREEEG